MKYASHWFSGFKLKYVTENSQQSIRCHEFEGHISPLCNVALGAMTMWSTLRVYHQWWIYHQRMQPQIRELLGNLCLHEYEVKSTKIKRPGFPGGSVVKNLHANARATGDTGLIPGLGRSSMVEKEMATCSSRPAWEIPWTVEPGALQSLWLQRIRHNLVTEHICIKRVTSPKSLLCCTCFLELALPWALGSRSIFC